MATYSTTPGTLMASGPAMGYCDNTISQDVIDATTYLQLFAHGASLAQLEQKGININDPAIYQSYDYFENYITSLTHLNLNVASASGNTVKVTEYSGSVKVGQILQDILSLYIPAAQLTNFESLTTILQSETNLKTTDFMNFWWDHTSNSETTSSFALGPITLNANNMPVFTVIYYSFTYSFSSWKTMFFSNTSSSTTVYSSAISLEVDMDILNKVPPGSKISLLQQIEDKLGSNTSKYIAKTPIAF